MWLTCQGSDMGGAAKGLLNSSTLGGGSAVHPIGRGFRSKSTSLELLQEALGGVQISEDGVSCAPRPIHAAVLLRAPGDGHHFVEREALGG